MIHTTRVVTTTVENENTLYDVVPGITSYVMDNEGVQSVVSSEDASGRTIASQTDTESKDNGSEDSTNSSAADDSRGDSSDTDSYVDGVQADEIQTPQGNISLGEDNDTQASAGSRLPLIAGFGAAAAAAVLLIILFVRRKHMKASGR